MNRVDDQARIQRVEPVISNATLLARRVALDSSKSAQFSQRVRGGGAIDDQREPRTLFKGGPSGGPAEVAPRQSCRRRRVDGRSPAPLPNVFCASPILTRPCLIAWAAMKRDYGVK